MATPLPDPAWSDSTDLCIACGYSLAGLSPPGRCPECGAPFEAGQLVLAGVPRSSSGVPLGRRLAWAATILGGFLYANFALVLFVASWVLGLVATGVLAGALIWLLVTGPRDRRGVERFVFSVAGVARLPLVHEPGVRLDTVYVPWTGYETVELRRISNVWRRLRVGQRRAPGAALIEVSFDAGVRCPDARAESVRAVIQSYIAQLAPQVPAVLLAPPTSPRR